MTSTTPTQHDALFKGLLGKPEHARGVLREVVPAAVAEAIDWQTLTPVSGNFVDLELRQQYTDLLFSARWHDGSELLAYFLFEHLCGAPHKSNRLQASNGGDHGRRAAGSIVVFGVLEARVDSP